MEKYQNPRSPLNGKKYRTGKLCVEGCGRAAGTAWSPLWCQPCNAKRMDRITESLDRMIAKLENDHDTRTEDHGAD